MRTKLSVSIVMMVLVVFMFFFIAIGVAEEESTDASGQWKYTLEDGGATITGYVEEPSGDLVIPGELDGYAVVGIFNFAFADCAGLTGVTVFSGVCTIGYGAFSDCADLTRITPPDGVKRIDQLAFGYCEKLSHIAIPATVTEIVAEIVGHPFVGCDALVGIDVAIENPAYESIGGVLFAKDPKALVCYPKGRPGTAYVVPEGTQSIGASAFEGCSQLIDVTLPDGITAIGASAFRNCSSLYGINIPNGITKIRGLVFEGCTALTSVIIPEGVLSIENYAFDGCAGLTSITIPESVALIMAGAFRQCPNLTLMVAEGSYSALKAERSGIPYALDGRRVSTPFRAPVFEYMVYTDGAAIYAYSGEDLDPVIPEVIDGYPVTRIQEGAFRDRAELISITIPRCVKKIGVDAFVGCDNLTLTITEGSYAQQYAEENDIQYVLTSATVD